MELENGYWNGEPARFRVVDIIVGPEPEELTKHLTASRPDLKRYLWFEAFVGEKVQAIEVHFESSPAFYLSNIDGSGLYKVTDGRGSPNCTHYSIYPKTVLATVSVQNWRRLNSVARKLMHERIDAYFMQKDPSGYQDHKQKIESLKKEIYARR